MGGEHHVEILGAQQVHRLPAGQAHQQAKDAAHQQEYHRGHGIGLDQVFRRAVEFQAGVRAGPEYFIQHLRCIDHVRSPYSTTSILPIIRW